MSIKTRFDSGSAMYSIPSAEKWHHAFIISESGRHYHDRCASLDLRQNSSSLGSSDSAFTLSSQEHTVTQSMIPRASYSPRLLTAPSQHCHPADTAILVSKHTISRQTSCVKSMPGVDQMGRSGRIYREETKAPQTRK